MGLKIGLVTGEYPPMEGGVGAFTKELAKGLYGAGHTIHIISKIGARPTTSTRKFWEPHEPIDLGYAQLHPRVNRWWWSANSTVAEICVDRDLDLINIQYQTAAYSMYFPAVHFLPWRLKELVSVVVTFHDLRVPFLFPKAGPLRGHLVTRLARSADGVIATNQEDYNVLLGVGVDARRVAWIPIGSNIKVRVPPVEEVAALRSQLGLGQEDILLGYFGFLNKSKGADILVNALGQLDDRFRLVFIGGKTGSSDTGSNQAFLEELEALIDDLELGDRVCWSGFIPDPQVSTYLHAADLMVMPYRDGVSLRRGTLMAILAHGRPLVTSRPETRLPELVHGENVWLTSLDDPRELEEAIAMLSENQNLRTELGQSAMRLSATFSWENIAAETGRFYRSILEQGR